MSHSIVTRIVLCDDAKLLGMSGLAVYQSARNPKEAYVGCHAAGNIFLGITMTPLISKRSAQAVVVDGVVEAALVCAEEEGRSCGILPIGYPIISNQFTTEYSNCHKHALTFHDRKKFAAFNRKNNDAIVGIFIQSTGKEKAIVKLQKGMKYHVPSLLTLDIGNQTFVTKTSDKNDRNAIEDTAGLLLDVIISEKINSQIVEKLPKKLDLSSLPNGAEIADAMFNDSSPYYSEAHRPISRSNSILTAEEAIKLIQKTAQNIASELIKNKKDKPTKNRSAKRPKIAGRNE